MKGGGAFVHWVEAVEGKSDVVMAREDGLPAMIADGSVRYLAGWPDDLLWDRIVTTAGAAAGIEIQHLPVGLRLRDTATHRFAFNYSPKPLEWNGVQIPPAEVEWWPL